VINLNLRPGKRGGEASAVLPEKKPTSIWVAAKGKPLIALERPKREREESTDISLEGLTAKGGGPLYSGRKESHCKDRGEGTEKSFRRKT